MKHLLSVFLFILSLIYWSRNYSTFAGLQNRYCN